MSRYRPGLPDMPLSIQKLPVDARGYPVPWFVSWIDGQPEFRVADAKKSFIAVSEGRCWVCGSMIRSTVDQTFVIGPMCAVNRISSEPPSHRECAIFSAKACPFLVKPHMVRRENDLPAEMREPPGIGIKRNPGVMLLWRTASYDAMREGQGLLFRLTGDPLELACYKEGREATRVEIAESVESGIPILRAAARTEGLPALSLLAKQIREGRKLLDIACGYCQTNDPLEVKDGKRMHYLIGDDPKWVECQIQAA